MTNSHSAYLLGLYKALICKDGCRTFPTLSKELGRDYQRLVSSVNSRGLRVLTIDLPALGKEFDHSLHEKRLNLTSNFLTGKRGKASVYPKLFGGILMRVFDADGTLRSDACVDAIRFMRQVYNLAKKWKAPCKDSYTFEQVREFFRVDAEVREPTLSWREPYLQFTDPLPLSVEEDYVELINDKQLDLLGPVVSPLASLSMEKVLRKTQQVFDIMSTTLGLFDPANLLAKHGPGVVSDLHKGNSKYEFPVWPERLEVVFQSARFAFANYGLWADYVRDTLDGSEDSDYERQPNPYRNNRFEGVEAPSRLIAVPKTHKGPRLIAAEPTANQWCQQIIRTFLYDRTHQSWLGRMISFRYQWPNQVIALAASKDGSKSTIDLSSASDRMSCWLVERAFRRSPDLLRALHASRTFIIRNTIDKKPSEFSYLRKFCTMGSAVTFPVQSLVFASICLAALHYVENRRVSLRSCKELAGQVRVFGDDIIVPDHATECTVRLLEHLGFKVNTSKTFSGPSRFRESCGVEAYNGEDVTPCYALTAPDQSAPDTYVSCVAQAHNFYKRGWHACVDYIRRTTTRAGVGILPWVRCESGVFGWPSPFGFDIGKCKTRVNKRLQRVEYLARSVVWRVTKRPDRGPSRLLQYFVEAPTPEVLWMSGVAVKGRVLTRPSWAPLPD